MIAIQMLEPGVRLKLKGDVVVEVVENPRDGTWLVARPIAAAGTPGTSPDLVHADDVLEQLPAG